MPALNLPGLTTPALPASAAASSAAIGARDIGQTGADSTPAPGSDPAADTPAASFGQHLRHARGKTASGSRSSDIDQTSTARNPSGSVRRAWGTTSGESGTSAWPSTIQTASMTGGRWTGRGSSAGTLPEGTDSRATALLEAALQKTSATDQAAGDRRARMSDRSAAPSTPDLQAISGLLAAAEREAAMTPTTRSDACMASTIALSPATAEVTPATDQGAPEPGVASAAEDVEISLVVSPSAEAVIAETRCDDHTPASEPEATDVFAFSLANPDLRTALAAITAASAKGKTADDSPATPTPADDTSVLALESEHAEPADEKKPTRTDDEVDPQALAAEAAVLVPLPQPPAASPDVALPQETAADDARPDVVSSSSAAQEANRDATDAQTLTATTPLATSTEPTAKRTDVAADDAGDQPAQPSDEPSATPAVTQTSPAPAPTAAATSHNAQPVTSATPAVLPAAQPTAQPDASLTRVQDIASAIPQASVTPVYDGTIDPAIDTAAFAPALGARIAVLARDGVEQARLNVHPADMGPIAVQLSLDGTQVRVDFSADMAGTRQTLEEAMPSLAASLRDAGFTLSGGGVSQQSAQSGGSSDGNRTANNAGSATPGNTANDDAGNASLNTSTNRSSGAAGLVDLFA